MRAASGGIHIECSTYSRIRTLNEDFTDPAMSRPIEVDAEIAPLANPNLMAPSGGSILQDLDKLPKNQFRPPTFPFGRSFSWQPSPFVSARSPRETR
jgi:microcystin degradation protein MlrC